MDLWNAVTGLIFLLSAGTFVVLARHLSRRPVEEENRLALLQRVVGLFNRVADLSEIVPKGESEG